MSVEENLMVLLFGKPIPASCVRINKASNKVLEIDVEKAWRDSGEDAGWSNEVSIEVFVH